MRVLWPTALLPIDRIIFDYIFLSKWSYFRTLDTCQLLALLLDCSDPLLPSLILYLAGHFLVRKKIDIMASRPMVILRNELDPLNYVPYNYHL